MDGPKWKGVHITARGQIERRQRIIIMLAAILPSIYYLFWTLIRRWAISPTYKEQEFANSGIETSNHEQHAFHIHVSMSCAYATFLIPTRRSISFYCVSPWILRNTIKKTRWISNRFSSEDMLDTSAPIKVAPAIPLKSPYIRRQLLPNTQTETLPTSQTVSQGKISGTGESRKTRPILTDLKAR